MALTSEQARHFALIGAKKRFIPFETRFWSKVNISTEGSCWNWTACVNALGYGIISRSRKANIASRISWELKHGPIPDGLCILHKCDNPRCVNPNHLFLGTRPENTADMIKKGRAKHNRGELSGRAKLTRDQVVEIRHLYASVNFSQSELGKQFGVSKSTIAAILRRRSWSHI